MSEASKTWTQGTLWGTTPATSSPGYPDGPSPSGSPDGRTTAPSGLGRARARRSPPPAKRSDALNVEGVLSRALAGLVTSSASGANTPGSPTADTCGPSSGVSSATAALQSFLASRLAERMAGYGSPEYGLRWDESDTPLGPPICRLWASGRRTSANDCSGWPTPDAGSFGVTDGSWEARRAECKERHGNNGFGLTLGMAATLAGWATPGAEMTNTTPEAFLARKGRRPDGAVTDLAAQVSLAGWATPNVPNGGRTSNTSNYRDDGSKRQVDLAAQATLAGPMVSPWATPSARDWKSESATPEFNAERDAHPRGKPLSYEVTLVSGETPASSTAGTAKSGASRGALNPAFSGWLMGFPPSWFRCGLLAMTATRSSPKKSRGGSASSKATATPSAPRSRRSS